MGTILETVDVISINFSQWVVQQRVLIGKHFWPLLIVNACLQSRGVYCGCLTGKIDQDTSVRQTCQVDYLYFEVGYS